MTLGEKKDEHPWQGDVLYLQRSRGWMLVVDGRDWTRRWKGLGDQWIEA